MVIYLSIVRNIWVCSAVPIVGMQQESVAGYPARRGQSRLADPDESDRVFTPADCHLPLSISAKTSLATRIPSSAAAMPQ